MNRRAMPDDHELAWDLAEQDAQKAYHRLAVVVVVPHLEKQAAIKRDPADCREMVMGQLDTQHGRLPAGGPRAHRQREQIEARLVYPDNRSAFIARFFWSAGHRSS